MKKTFVRCLVPAWSASIAAAMFGFGLMLGTANASTYYFQSVNGGTVANQDIAETDLFFDLIQDGTGVVFKFQNLGSDASITDIYFDSTSTVLPFFSSGELTLGTSSAGVSFSVGASPPDLPGGGAFSANFGTDSNPPVAPNGIDTVGEFLNIILANKTVAQVQTAFVSFALLVGIHVQSFPDEASMSFVNNANPGELNPVVPLPAALPLLLGGLGGLAWISRRQKRRSNITA